MITYKLGDQVKVTGVVDSAHRGFLKRVYKIWRRRKLDKEITGIVVRKVYKRGGVVHPSSGGYGPDGDFEPAWLECKRQYLVYEVAFSMNRKTILVRPNQMELVRDQ